MLLTLLGTGNPIPDPRRAGPSQLVRVGDDRILVDCGMGAVRRLVEALLRLLAWDIKMRRFDERLSDETRAYRTSGSTGATPAPA